MEKRVLKFEFDVGTTSRSTTGANEDVGRAMELVQRERDRDVKEKDELRHLNDRFSHFLSNIEQLKKINEQLQAQLKDEFSKWGILPRDENELRQIVNQINDRAIKRANDEVRSRAAEQESAILNRAAALYGNIQDMYKRKQENLRNLIDRLQEEINRISQHERLSDEEVSTTRDDLLKELKKFRDRLQDWLRIVVDKQVLLDDIQSLRERINLINALNEEEINEWKRLLDQSKDDSISFYKEELTNAIRDIKRDYSKQAKKFQDELEYQIEGQLRMVENQLKQTPGLMDGSMQEAEKNRLQIEETKLRTIMEEYDKEQVRLNELTKMLSDKRRLLRDEEAKLHEVERKIRDKQFNERTIAERLKNEYEDLRGRFEQMAFELRFSIEDELRIYSRLLDELMKKSTINTTSTVTQGGGSTGATTYTTTSSTIRSGGIEDRDVPSSYQQTRTSSSNGGTGNVTFDLGSGNSLWSNTQTTNLGGTGSLFRVDDNDAYGTTSITRTSSSFSPLD
jgi:DNA repair exonuclease SbcCD ATPase subunit